AFLGLSKPSKWRFLVKNSETEISRCRAPISAAETVFGAGGSLAAVAPLGFNTGFDICFGSPYIYILTGPHGLESWNAGIVEYSLQDTIQQSSSTRVRRICGRIRTE